MDATRFDDALPGSPFLFDIYNDGQPARTHPASTPLPGGPCNYTDPTLPRCGCRRFWSRQSGLSSSGGGVYNIDLNASLGLAEMCMCSHHACFHEDMPPSGLSQFTHMAGAGPGQENEKPRSKREPLSPVQDLGLASFSMPTSLCGSVGPNDFLALQQASGTHLWVGNPARTHSVENLENAEREASIPDTLSYTDFMREEEEAARPNSLRPLPLPSQCLVASQAPSTSASCQARFLRPFSGRGLQTLESGAPGVRDRESLADTTQANTERGPANTLDTRPAGAGPGTPEESTVRKSARGERAQSCVPMTGMEDADDALQELSTTVQNHEQRLDRLENASFSVAVHEDCADKHEHTDLRVTELETRVEHVESMLHHDASSTGSARHFQRRAASDDATISVMSMSSETTASASFSRLDVRSQILALQSQVSQLQAIALPTYTRPWELEVVFLLFPLKGIWLPADDFPPQRPSAERGANAEPDEWTQMPNTLSRATPDPHSQWTGDFRTSHWLMPRAFPTGRVIDQRLQSRGLIQKVSVRGPDARSVQLAVNSAFEHVLRMSALTAGMGCRARGSEWGDYLGLRQNWVPLRKLHKDSRLRFLAPAEMATPALWDFCFLSSSVVMKAMGMHRLYVTQPEAYLQDDVRGHHALQYGWTWQKLRQLARVYPRAQNGSSSNNSQVEVPEADAMEESWAWNDRLDEVPVSHQSMASLRHDKPRSRRSSTSPSEPLLAMHSSTSSRGERPQSVVLSREPLQLRGPCAAFARTSPHPAALVPAGAAQPRRLTTPSVGVKPVFERRGSPLTNRLSPRMQTAAVQHCGSPASMVAVSRRRHSTRSPSLMPRNTPRWSRASMSRSPSLAPMSGYPGFEDRRSTPFYYATPHSNAPPEPVPPHRAGSRGPLLAHADAYCGYEFDEDMEEYDDRNRGSLPDPCDSPQNNKAADDELARHQAAQGPRATDSDDVDVYEDEDEADELDGVDTEDNGSQWHAGDAHPAQHGIHGIHGHPPPEDIPWTGIEDQLSDSENVNPSESRSFLEAHEDEEDAELVRQNGHVKRDADYARSEASSVPSEYPSTQRAWGGQASPSPSSHVIAAEAGAAAATAAYAQPLFGNGSFDIHEDEGDRPTSPVEAASGCTHAVNTVW